MLIVCWDLLQFQHCANDSCHTAILAGGVIFRNVEVFQALEVLSILVGDRQITHGDPNGHDWIRCSNLLTPLSNLECSTWAQCTVSLKIRSENQTISRDMTFVTDTYFPRGLPVVASPPLLLIWTRRSTLMSQRHGTTSRQQIANESAPRSSILWHARTAVCISRTSSCQTNADTTSRW